LISHRPGSHLPGRFSFQECVGTRIVLASDTAAAARLATRATTPVHTAPLGTVPGVYNAITADVDECSVLVLDLAILADQLGQCQADLLQ
jgi:hypothetical protein